MTYITDINPSNPAFNDPAGQGDDQIRVFKADVKNSFPNADAPVTATPVELNYSTGVTSSIQTQFTNTTNAINLKAPLADPNLTGVVEIASGAVGTALAITSTTPTSFIAFTDDAAAPSYMGISGEDMVFRPNNVLAMTFADDVNTSTVPVVVPATTGNDQAIRRTTWATATLGGTLKVRIDGTDAYMTFDGTNP